jgi:hypothetical protein
MWHPVWWLETLLAVSRGEDAPDCCRDAAPFERWGPSYADGVEQVPTIEDSRGVDISQIRRQLRMTVPERVRSMVEAANTMLAIQERAQASLRREL